MGAMIVYFGGGGGNYHGGNYHGLVVYRGRGAGLTSESWAFAGGLPNICSFFTTRQGQAGASRCIAVAQGPIVPYENMGHAHFEVKNSSYWKKAQ